MPAATGLWRDGCARSLSLLVGGDSSPPDRDTVTRDGLLFLPPQHSLGCISSALTITCCHLQRFG